MRFLITVILFVIIGRISVSPQAEQYSLIQNKPVEIGTTVTFTISAPEGSDPFVAWDFGDGNGLGRYKRGLTTTCKFMEPGVYQVFARIQGTDIPLYCHTNCAQGIA